MIGIIAVSLSGCGEIKKAEASVNAMFVALKNLDFNEAQKYVDVNDIKLNDDSGEQTKLIMDKFLSKLDYEVVASNKVDGNNVIVKAKITAVDMKPIFAEYVSQLFAYAVQNAFSNTQSTEEDINKKADEVWSEWAAKPDLATVTNEVDIKVVRNENREWKIEADDSFVNALLGGIKDAAENVDNVPNAAN